MIEKGKIVGVHYTGKIKDGEAFDSSIGKDPLKFQVGSGQIIPGFENGIIGKNVGDKVIVDITPDEGYGQIREDLIIKVGKDQMPGDVQIGQKLSAQSDNGQEVNVVVKEILESEIIIDGNHPLAGKDLVFEIEVVEIEETQE